MENIIETNPIIRIINDKAKVRKNESKLGLTIYSLYLIKKCSYKMLKKNNIIS